ncbi:hypothetical protein OS493_005347 [Desmophyllum pertusum]|uniref:Snake toxin/toxin-like domain-containing protein n=1 Tax=Desmophyllum pertusum TaxID=174260 RepID=A0A9X0CM62_9CNID|nr:hypothetical protein OS493_005347 [Desmophyllum pertusum]
MKLWLVGACILYLSLPVALGLNCYSCNSSKSWDDCQAESKRKSCPTGTYRCDMFFVKKPNGTEMFTKDCLAGAQWSPCSPEDNPACRDGDACIISCCNSDYCNSDSVGTTFGTTVDAAVGTTVGWFNLPHQRYSVADMRPGISDDSCQSLTLSWPD